MRSASFLTLFFFTLLSVLQGAFAEPAPVDELVERGSGLDIAATPGNPLHQSTLGGRLTLSKSKSEKAVCPVSFGLCPNDPTWCCRLNGRCCGGKKCCDPGNWCYGPGCCPISRNGCDNKSCIPKGAQCCKGGSYCNAGYNCIRNPISWVTACCPKGKICLFKGGKQATDANAA